MWRSGLLGGWSACAVAGGCVVAPDLRGPMPVRNQHPAQLTVQHLPPRSAAVLAARECAVRTDLAYTSLWLIGSAGGRRFAMDGEYLRTGVGLRAGLGRGLEAGLELPFAHTTGGFLDGFVIAYHDVFGMPDQNRDRAPRDRFGIEARQNGDVIWEVDRDDLAVLDVPLDVSWQIADPARGTGLLLRAGVELPTGDDERGYGSGELDVALGALVERRAFGCSFTAHAQHTFAGTPANARRAGFHFDDVTSVGGAVELPLDDGVAALVQVEWETSTLRDLDLRVADREQLLLWLGLRVDLDARWSMEVGLGEDLQGLVSPDFTAWMAFAWRPGGAAGG